MVHCKLGYLLSKILSRLRYGTTVDKGRRVAGCCSCRARHSPDACQGAQASEDVCDAPAQAVSRFELIALEDGPGIR